MERHSVRRWQLNKNVFFPSPIVNFRLEKSWQCSEISQRCDGRKNEPRSFHLASFSIRPDQRGFRFVARWKMVNQHWSIIKIQSLSLITHLAYASFCIWPTTPKPIDFFCTLVFCWSRVEACRLFSNLTWIIGFFYLEKYIWWLIRSIHILLFQF